MKKFATLIIGSLVWLGGLTTHAYASKFIAADNANIQYFGRWDFSIPASPSHSWPGVSIYAEFSGTSIGIRMSDNYCYYNVIIDDSISTIFHGTIYGQAAYTLATGLANTRHTIHIVKRNETGWTAFSFQGFYVDDAADLLTPKPKPVRKIEFIGDSFTSASGNEWTDNTTAPDERYTNIYEGFGPITARHYGAQWQMTSQSGFGLVVDYQGVYANNLPDRFDRTLSYTALPKWNFDLWVPNVVVICLGLNDYNGFGGYTGSVAQSKRDLFKSTYHTFITRIRTVYPGVKILALSAHPDWIRAAVSEVVAEETLQGNRDVSYAYFPYYEGGYVNSWHPNVASHKKIADQIIATMDQMNPWVPYNGNTPPKIVSLPSDPFTVYDTTCTLKIVTDTYATLRLSRANTSYDKMDTVFTSTGKRTHSITLSCAHNRSYIYYIRASDANGNKMDTSAVVRFTVDTTKAIVSWKSPAYEDATWKTGATPMGTSALGSNMTVLSPVTTAYMRKQFTISDLSSITEIDLALKGNGGAIVYVNGEEITRINMPADSVIEYVTPATGTIYPRAAIAMNAANGLLSRFKNGSNTIAVEVHRANAGSSIVFDARLYDNTNEYFPLGSVWKYDDKGIVPAIQLRDKVTTGIARDDAPLPRGFALYQNYPNPFNPSTRIRYSIPQSADVDVRLFDVLGNELATLVNSREEAGMHTVMFDASHLAAGIYFLRMHAGSYVSTVRMAYIK